MISNEVSTSTPAADAPANVRTTRRNRNRRSQNVSSQIAMTNPSTYEGDYPAVGAILALRLEKFDKKLAFEQFVDKVCMYVVTTLKDGGDMQILFREMKDPLLHLNSNYKPKKPIDDKAPDYSEDLDLYKAEITAFTQRKLNLRRNKEKSFGLVWGQCSAGLQSYIKGIESYVEKSNTFELLWLLTQLKKATAGIDDKANPFVTIHNAMSALYKMRQGNNESNDRYLERFKANVLATELTYGSHVFYSPELSGKERHLSTHQEITLQEEKSKAVLLLMNSDMGRYQKLATSLEDATYLSRDEYPTTTAAMYELMIKHTRSLGGSTNGRNDRNNTRSGVALAQHGQRNDPEDDNATDTPVPGDNGVTHEDIQCFNCHAYGHYSSNCPELSRRSGSQSL